MSVSTQRIQDLELSARLPTRVSKGKPILLVVTLRNARDTEVEFQETDPVFEITVTRDDGKQLTTTKDYRSEFERFRDGFMYLRPGGIMTREFDLTKWYEFRESGLYRVSVKRSFDEVIDAADGPLELRDIRVYVGRVPPAVPSGGQ